MQTLRGKVFYAEGQLFGMLPAPLVWVSSDWLRSGACASNDLVLKWALADLQSQLGVAAPRSLQPRSSSLLAVVYTDGACKVEVTIGAVQFIHGSRPKFFGIRVPEKVHKS